MEEDDRHCVRGAADAGDPPLYVIAIAAITNVASAILTAPDIREKIVVLWLGGHPLYWPRTDGFNLRQDPAAARAVLDCGVPLVLFPCRLVAELLTTTPAELDAHLAPASAIGGYLAGIFRGYERAALGLGRRVETRPRPDATEARGGDSSRRVTSRRVMSRSTGSRTPRHRRAQWSGVAVGMAGKLSSRRR